MVISCVVDIQGFSLTDGFAVKELAISDGKMMNHYVFKPQVPYSQLTHSEQKQIAWLENNHHSLRYEDGHVSLSELDNILHRFTAHVNLIFVKGKQKIQFLKQYITNVPIVNLEYSENIPNLVATVDSNSCMYHNNKSFICCIANVKTLCEKLFKQ